MIRIRAMLSWMRAFLASSPALAAVSAAALIALLEVDRLIGAILGADGRASSVADATGPGAFGGMGAWDIWESATVSPYPFIWVYTVLDLIFVATYVALLWRVAGPLGEKWARPWYRGVRVLAGAEIAEAVLITLHTFFPGWVLDVLVALAASVKWGAVLFLLIRLFSREMRAGLRKMVAQLRALIAVHRVGVIILVALAAISVVPQADILEQLPDVQRSWILWDYETGDVTFNGGPIAGAVIGAILVTLVLFLIGRVRSRHFARLVNTQRTPPDVLTYVFWFAAPGLALIVFGCLLTTAFVMRTDLLHFVDWGPLVVFVAVTLGIGLISLRWDLKKDRPADDIDQPFVVAVEEDAGGATVQVTTIARVTRFGEVISAASIVVAGLGMVRSFTAPAVLGLPEYVDNGAENLAGVAVVSAGFAFLGLAVAVFGTSGFLVWLFTRFDDQVSSPAASPVIQEVAAPVGAEPAPPSRGEIVLRWILGGGALIVLGLVTLLPLPLTDGRVLLTAVIILLAWGCLLTAVESRLQEHRALRVFSAFRLRSAPLLTLFVAIPFVVSLFGGVPALHAMQTGTSVAVGAEAVDPYRPVTDAVHTTRPTLDAAFREWADAADCTVTTGGVSYRPLLLVAAQGGGIRAAAWTTNILSEVQASRACAPTSILMSSGASGGSVGLAMFRGDFPENGAVTTDTIRNEDALAAGLAGTLVMDNFAAVTGLRVPSSPGYTEDGSGHWVWQDRAALIQARWAENSGRLAEPYDFEYQQSTGWLLLNSTAAGAGCRAIISQLDLEIGTGRLDEEGSARPTCGSDTPSVSSMIDVQAYCDLEMDWATAAMFSSRFPIVTPAGRVVGTGDDCSAIAGLQLADGGYSENSGLGTLSDLAPELTALIRDRNAEEAASDAPKAPIIPFLLYVRNEGGADVSAPVAEPAADLLVPLRANDVKAALITETSWLQRLSESLGEVCVATDTACTDALEAAAGLVDGGIAVAAPRTEPAIVSPLGWTLSDISRNQLMYAAEQQLDCSPTGEGARETAFGTLGDLLNAMKKVPDPDC